MVDIDKSIIPTKILWVDLEMTGLDPKKDLILEVAAEVTDFDFKTLGNYETRVQHPKDTLVALFQANTWYRDVVPENRDDFLKTNDQAKPSEQVESELVEFIAKHFGSEPAVLAGNSIHNDRAFIKNYWPAVDLKLHYRMLDVTSWKVVMNAKYGVTFDKKEVHRAFDDIQASIAELQYYLEWFSKN
jgi:oligoribonuclease